MTHPADGSLALQYLRAIVRGFDVDREAIWLVIPGQPAAKERARRGAHGRFYTPERTRAAEEAIAMYWRASIQDRMLDCAIALSAVFCVVDETPIDTDNALKLLMDAGTKAEAWSDDSCVVVHTAAQELDAEKPRTVVAYCPTESTLERAAKWRCRACLSPLSRVSRGLCRCGVLNQRRRS